MRLGGGGGGTKPSKAQDRLSPEEIEISIVNRNETCFYCSYQEI
jgi:hypothetical protein